MNAYDWSVVDDEPWPFPADLTAGSAIYIGSYAIGAICAALVALVLVLLVRKVTR